MILVQSVLSAWNDSSGGGPPRGGRGARACYALGLGAGDSWALPPGQRACHVLVFSIPNHGRAAFSSRTRDWLSHHVVTRGRRPTAGKI